MKPACDLKGRFSDSYKLNKFLNEQPQESYLYLAYGGTVKFQMLIPKEEDEDSPEKLKFPITNFSKVYNSEVNKDCGDVGICSLNLTNLFRKRKQIPREIVCMYTSRNNKKIFVADDNGYLKQFTYGPYSTLLRSLNKVHKDEIIAMCTDSTDELLFTASKDGFVKKILLQIQAEVYVNDVWNDSETNDHCSIWRRKKEAPHKINCMVISDSKKMLYIGTEKEQAS